MEDLFGKATRGKRLKSDDRVVGNLPFVTAGEAEEGISAFIGNDVRVFPENTVTIDMFGSAKYRGYDYGCDDHVAVVHCDTLPKRTVIFLASAINKSSNNGQFNYSRNFYAKDADALTIRLPVCDGKPDFAFMELFIAELEAYLAAAGLKNTTLTEAEKQALRQVENKEIEWREFTYRLLFDHIKQGRRLKKDDQLPGEIPFVMSGTTNTGVVGHISNPVTSFPKNAITVDIFGNAFYRNYAFGAGDDTGVYWNDKNPYSKYTMIFLTSAMGRSTLGKFSYGKKLRSSKSLNFVMKLPMLEQKPDFELMENLISAVQKLVIKDVVDYADKKVTATHHVIQKESI